MNTSNKQIAFRYFGCRLNLFETSALSTEFVAKGWQQTDETNADWIVVNTCGVTERAEEKNRQAIRRLHRENPNAKIILTGCYATQKERELALLDGVYKVVNNNQKGNIFSLLQQLQEETEQETTKKIAQEIAQEKNIFGFSYYQKPSQSRAYLKIQDGCNRSCSYCQIPFSRGKAMSRPLEEIKTELKKILGYGFQEIVLTGVNLGDYSFTGRGNFGNPVVYNLYTLLEELSLIQGENKNWYFRLGSLEPDTICQDILPLYREKKLASFLHAPLQSGSNKILALMKRDYDKKLFQEKIAMVHSFDPNIRITSDVIVGFPNESQDDFDETINTITKNFISGLHVFPYSPRPDTSIMKEASLEFTDSQTAADRVRRLRELSEQLSMEYQKNIQGKTFRAIVEKNKTKENFLRLLTENNFHVDLRNLQLDEKDLKETIDKNPNRTQEQNSAKEKNFGEKFSHGQMLSLQKLHGATWQIV